MSIYPETGNTIYSTKTIKNEKTLSTIITIGNMPVTNMPCWGADLHARRYYSDTGTDDGP